MFAARGLCAEPEEPTMACLHTGLCRCFKPLFYRDTPKIILHAPIETYLRQLSIGRKTEWRFLAYGYYYSVANCRTKVPAMFQGTFGVFRGI